MKQIYFLLAVFCNTVLLSQTVLTSYPLDLNNQEGQSQIVNAENTVTHDVFAFIASPENFTILKYNSALFLKDQFTETRKYSESKILMGYSFGEDGNPTLYWLSPVSKNIIIIKYYLETKTSKALKFDFPDNQLLVTQYKKDNAFYLLMQKEDKQGLTLFVFNNGTVEEKFLDFSPFTFLDQKIRKVTFNQILRQYPIRKMDSGEYNELYKAIAKTKLYTLPNRLILTLDHNLGKTQLFDINIENLEIKEREFIPPTTENSAKSSNSFYHENKLYQLSANSDQLLLDIKDFNSGELIKNFTVVKKDTISFKNSPLLIQKENFKPRKVKNTAKFLKQLSFSDIGLSVFKNRKNLFLTIGGISTHYSSWNDSDNFFTPDNVFNSYPGDVYESSYIESAFFESILNKNLETTRKDQEPLATDKIYYFIDNHKEIKQQNILKLTNYSILGYYDSLLKQYVMRKFTDGYN